LIRRHAMKRGVLLLMVVSISAHGEELWFNAGAVSYHEKNTSKFNQGNYGFGVEYQFDRRNLVVGGELRNSDRGHTYYLIYGWSPLDYGTVRGSLFAGIGNGYPPNKAKWHPAAAPGVIIETRHIGVNVVVGVPFEIWTIERLANEITQAP
jgi:hypothetical protein